MNTRTMSGGRRRHARGAALFIAMAILILVTLLALAAARVTAVQQSGVAAMAFAEQAFQNAERTAREAEQQLELAPQETLCELAGTVPVMRPERAATARGQFLDRSAWPTQTPALANYAVRGEPVDGSDGSAHPPVYVIEAAQFLPDTIETGSDAYGRAGGGAAGCGDPSGRGVMFYRVAVRAAGPEEPYANGMPGTQATIEAVFARRR